MIADHVLDYRVFSEGKWLADDEKSWTAHFEETACFTSWELADDIAKRECAGARTWYVLAVMARR